ncbi:PREDICTED: protein sax-3-like [Priapulus caudatus]|uniref:Protein sax-3-like n=1 Tax=Priapulus caudatus TaxID=37621 RepID=A0ABM1EYT9_PRICU|nr:PREDICTED: protein sax-3-like [Priapulus caudatus]
MLDCDVSSAVPYNVTWYRQGAQDPIRSSHRVINHGNGSMELLHASRRDEGNYVCRAENEGGVAQAKFYLQIQELPKVTISPSEQSYREGDTLDLTCLVYGIPTPTSYWTNSSDDRRLNSTDRMIVNSGTLVILDAKEEDAGIYHCVGKNEAGIDTKPALLKFIGTIRSPSIDSLSFDRLLLLSRANST